MSNADELSRFAEILRRGGELDGIRIMKPETLYAAIQPARRMRPDVATGLKPMRWGTGYMLGGKRWGPFGRNTASAFGHTGLVDIAVWADPARALSAAIVSSGKPGAHREANRYPRCWTASRPRFRSADSAQLLAVHLLHRQHHQHTLIRDHGRPVLVPVGCSPAAAR